MVRFAILLILVLGLVALPAQGVISVLLHDDFDDRNAIWAVRDVKAVKESRQQMDAFVARLFPLKERDIIALFGKPVPRHAETYAMPVAQPRGVGLSGIRYADPKLNKDHTEFYPVGDFAGIEVWYQIDGVSPAAILLYFRANRGFPKLTKDNLDQRLSLERERMKKLIAHFEKRRAEVFEWEIDLDQEKKLSQGLHSGELLVKLQALLDWGDQQGYRVDHTPARNEQTPIWEWYQGNRLIASAHHDRGHKGVAGMPSFFIFYRPDGTCLRDERGWPYVQHIRWCRPGGIMLRSEGGILQNGAWRPTCWSWHDRKGNAIRSEWDDNGDGIPDEYREGSIYEREPNLHLAVSHSWAVHPNLIPKELRLPDQPDRRIPIRRIPR